MPGSPTTPGRMDTRDDAPVLLPSVNSNSVGTRIFKLSRLHGWPMCSPADASPATLADASARLGADADRYSFIVVDSHHLLLAGLTGAPD